MRRNYITPFYRASISMGMIGETDYRTASRSIDLATARQAPTTPFSTSQPAPSASSQSPYFSHTFSAHLKVNSRKKAIITHKSGSLIGQVNDLGSSIN
jgi:hypothetical protein